MTKIHKFPVHVKVSRDDTGNLTPLAIYWDDEPYPVEILSQRELDTLRNFTGSGINFRVQSCGKTQGLIYDRTADNWTLEVKAM